MSRVSPSGVIAAGCSTSADEEAYSSLCKGDVTKAFWIVQQGRAVPARRGVDAGLSLDEIAGALPENAVFITIIAGASGGAALAVRAGSPIIHSLPLPRMTFCAVRSITAGGKVASGREIGLKVAYRRFHRTLGGQRVLHGNAWREWDAALRSALGRLGEIGWVQLHHWLREVLRVPRGSEVVISLPPPLSAIPVAAVRDLRSGRYFVDDYATRLIPNATVLVRCRQVAEATTRSPPTLLAVIDPRGDLGGNTDWLGRNGLGHGGHRAVLAGGQATQRRLLERLPQCTHYIHFGHGSRLRRRSVLEMAPELTESIGNAAAAELNDRQVRQLKLQCNRLSILAACESGVMNAGTSQGLSGMAASFLLAGSACVIGTLWPVESTTTRRLVERILQYHLGGNGGGSRPRSRPGNGGGCAEAMSPAQALRLAQIELRDSKDRSGRSTAVIADRRSAAGRVLHLRPCGSRPAVCDQIVEADIYYWAALSCLGG